MVAELSSKAVINSTWEGLDTMGQLLEGVREELFRLNNTCTSTQQSIATCNNPPQTDELSPLPDDTEPPQYSEPPQLLDMSNTTTTQSHLAPQPNVDQSTPTPLQNLPAHNTSTLTNRNRRRSAPIESGIETALSSSPHISQSPILNPLHQSQVTSLTPDAYAIAARREAQHHQVHSALSRVKARNQVSSSIPPRRSTRLIQEI